MIKPGGDFGFIAELLAQEPQAPSIDWEAARLTALRTKATDMRATAFDRKSAIGQLAVSRGDIEEASALLISMLDDFSHLYPHNHHFFTSIISLALAMKARKVAARFLNDRHDAPDLFVVEFLQETDDPAICRVTVDGNGRCHKIIDPRIPGATNADYFIGHWLSSTPLLAHYCRSSKWEPGSALINSGEHGRLPGLAYCGNKPQYILIPDGYFLVSEGYKDLRAKFKSTSPPWIHRKSLAFWRGSTTGIRSTQAQWQSLPRIELCKISLQHPNDLDAGIANIVQVSERERREIETSGLTRNAVSDVDFLHYKFQIDIDGNSNSWPGLFQKLLTGSPVLKIDSPHAFRQWYYDRLRPWVNFVPVQADMSDLIEKIEWLRSNERLAEQIGAGGKALADSLDYTTELHSACQTIAAAFRYSSGQPEIAVGFSDLGADNRYLLEGWGRAEPGAVPASGWESRIRIPRPIVTEDCVLSLDVSPSLSNSLPTAQRLSIEAGGEIRAQAILSARGTVRCLIPRRLFGRADSLEITLLHPDAAASASRIEPINDELRSVRIHGLTITPVGVHENAVEDPLEEKAARIPETQQGAVMQALYGKDVWHGFHPKRARQAEIQGWNGRFPGFADFLSDTRNLIILDVGVWKGQSTVFLAELMRQRKLDGCIIAIDDFLAEEHWKSDARLFERHPGGRPDVYETFLENIHYAGVAPLIVPLPAQPRTATRILRNSGIKAELIHYDASRDYDEILLDATEYWRLLKNGGHFIGDDYGPSWPGVMEAANEFARRFGGQLEIRSPKWILRKSDDPQLP